MLVITPELVRRTFARRADPRAPITRPSFPRLIASVAKAWTIQRTYWIASIEGEEELSPEVRAADEILQGKGSIEDASELTLSACERMLAHTSRSIAWLIADKRGLETAIRTKLGALELTIASKTVQGKWWWVLQRAKAREGMNDPYHFSSLRAAIASADDATYAKTRDAMKRDVTLAERCVLDFLFAAESNWANADLAEALAQKNFDQGVRLYSVLLASANDEAICTQFISRAAKWASLPMACDLVLGFEPEVSMRVVRMLLKRAIHDRSGNRKDGIKLAHAVTSFVHEEMADALAPLLLERWIGPYVVRYFRKHAHLAKKALGPIAEHRSHLGDVARLVLSGHAYTPARETSAPDLLRDPPWRHIPSMDPIEIETLPFEEKVMWKEGEREQMLAFSYPNVPPRDMTSDERTEYEALPPASRTVDIWNRTVGGKWVALRVPDELGLSMWNESESARHLYPATYMLARHGEAAIDGLLKRSEQMDAKLHVLSPRVAQLCARSLATRAHRRVAKTWLLEHPEVSAIGLVPDVLRGDRHADLALLLLARSGHETIVREVARRYGQDARIDARLARDPLAEIDAGVMKRVPLAELPRPIHRGLPLSEEGMGALLEMLSGASRVVPYRGFERVREELSSLDDLAIALFHEWLLLGAHDASLWMPLALGRIGGERSVRAFIPFAREVSKRSELRSELAVEVLGSMSSDLALVELAILARETSFGARQEAHQVIEDRAGTIPREDFELQHTPTLGLEDPILDFGGRTFHVALDASLVPYAEGEDGRRYHQLPRPSQKDDPEKARIAAERWRAITQGAESIARIDVARLEQMMVRGRTLAASDFTQHVARHPVRSILARGIVWSTRDRLFRITADGTLADDRDDPFLLRDDDRVGVPHAMHFPQADQTRWAQIFADYDIIQPFEQIGRAVHALDPSELGKSQIARLSGVRASPSRILSTIDLQGWLRPGGRTSINRAWRNVRGKDGKTIGQVWLAFTPGFYVALVDKAREQTFTNLTLTGLTMWDTVLPMDVSELLRDLDAFR